MNWTRGILKRRHLRWTMEVLGADWIVLSIGNYLLNWGNHQSQI